MYLKAFLFAILAFGAIQAYSLDFSQANFIWTNEATVYTAPSPSSRPFRRDFTTPTGKVAVAANILVIADNAYTLYVNGATIGNGIGWLNSNLTIQVAQAYCVPLGSASNVFAINATNIGTTTNPASLLAAIQILYNDGTSQNIVTDASWVYDLTFPAGWQQSTFNDSAWTPAEVEASYAGPYWSLVDTPPTPSNTTLSWTNANWIWTNEIAGAAGLFAAPISSRVFRKTITLPPGVFATFVGISIEVDDHYQLFVNGFQLGSDAEYTVPQQWGVYYGVPISEVTIAVNASNIGGPAGILATIELELEDNPCGTVASFVTDGSWKWSTTPFTLDLASPSYDDSEWPLAFVVGPYGMNPWGATPVPPPWGNVGPEEATIKAD